MIDAIRDVLLAPRCAGCGEPGAWFCVPCRDSCDGMLRGVGIRTRGVGAHEGPLRAAIHRFKYGAEPGLAEELGGLVAGALAADLSTGILVDAVVPVPLHRARALKRGYDQARLLADVVSLRTGVPLRAALRRIRPSAPQVELDRVARRKNVHHAFVAEAGALQGLRVALIDDVTTTGATLADAAKAARAAGARAVSGYVVAIDE